MDNSIKLTFPSYACAKAFIAASRLANEAVRCDLFERNSSGTYTVLMIY
ncbi:hypothetical protein [Sigmofec virus UA08Rod_4686]|uniref:Uncharacterized protein n=1 Tax=Sigmofec virus UA08Rod_4686 TaxID=2929406 RepID=A0A976N1W6_9VIRU|nr:hypothetical protein [Sigmofec virus UA08Rod_4686]